MPRKSEEKIEHHVCPDDLAVRLLTVGGVNRFDEPNFRLVWGYDRIVKMHGEWQEVEPAKPSGLLNFDGSPIMMAPRIKSSVIETREVPKYLPGNCWHLEKWCPPEDYGTPESWAKAGQEVVGAYTIDTAGPFPSRGEYELVFPLTSDCTPRGQPLPLADVMVEWIAQLIERSRNFSIVQRKAAIMQRLEREDRHFVARAESILRDSLPAFAGNDFVTKGAA